MAIKVFIQGGCVSRDPFEFDKENFELSHYSARSSIARLASKKITKKIDLSDITSNFQKRIVHDDIQKNLLMHLSNKQFDFFLIDFNVERFNLVNIDDDGFITKSNELSKSNYFKSRKNIKAIQSGSSEYFEMFGIGFDAIVDVLKNKNLLNKCIINKIYWTKLANSTEDVGFDTFQIDAINIFLDEIYSIVLSKYPEIRVIEYPETLLISNLNHKWGHTPYHYIDDFYHHRLDQLKKFFVEDLQSPKYRISHHSQCIFFEIEDNDDFSELQFAAYLFKDEVLVERIFYSNSQKFIFKNCFDGQFRVKYYCRYKGTQYKKSFMTKFISL